MQRNNGKQDEVVFSLEDLKCIFPVEISSIFYIATSPQV